MMPSEDIEKIRKDSKNWGASEEVKKKVRDLSETVATLLTPISVLISKVPEEVRTEVHAGMCMSLIMSRAKSIDEGMALNKRIYELVIKDLSKMDKVINQ